MELNPQHSIGDTLEWETVSGPRKGKVTEIHVRITPQQTNISYQVQLENHKYVIITE